MHKDPWLPIEYEEMLECEVSCLMFGKGKFTRDFGKFKAEEGFHTLVFDFESGTLAHYKDGQDETGQVYKLNLSAGTLEGAV